MQLTIDVQNDDKLEKLLLILKELNMEFFASPSAFFLRRGPTEGCRRNHRRERRSERRQVVGGGAPRQI